MPAAKIHPDLARLRARHVLSVVEARRTTTLRGWNDVEDVAHDLRLERRLAVSVRVEGGLLVHVVRRRPE